MSNKKSETPSLANRLLLHDRWIAVYHLRAAFSSVGDALTAVVASAAAVALARYALFSPVVVSIAASVIAAYLYYVLLRRIVFFRTNSVLADVALDVRSARQYVFYIATICCLAVTALLLPNLLLMSSFLVSFCTSILIAVLLSKLLAAIRRRISYQKLERLDRLLASRYRSKGMLLVAVGAAAIVFAAARFLSVPFAMSIATLMSVAVGLWYSPIAHSILEYQRLVGLTPTYSLRTKLRNCVLLASALTVGASLSFEWQVAGVVVAVFGLLLLFKGLEVLIVRAVGASKAQISMLVILFSLVTIAMVWPFLLLLLVPACGWWLLAKGRRRTWQLS